jgi:hypothetical protein
MQVSKQRMGAGAAIALGSAVLGSLMLKARKQAPLRSAEHGRLHFARRAAAATGAQAIGAMAIGAFAVGALAIGRLAIRRPSARDFGHAATSPGD